MGVFDKLLAIKQISFKDGDIRLMKQRVMFVPLEMATVLTKQLIDKPANISKVYLEIKHEFKKGWADQLKKSYSFDSRKYMEWLINLTNLSGWGINEISELDSKNKTGVFIMKNSPIAEHYKGTQNVCVDHFIRALYAGGASVVFGDDIDWLEIECIAKGDKNCKFVFGPRDALLTKYPNFTYQIK